MLLSFTGIISTGDYYFAINIATIKFISIYTFPCINKFIYLIKQPYTIIAYLYL
ncbi:putative membrane protein, partial [Bacteroides fragilis str. S36L11]